LLILGLALAFVGGEEKQTIFPDGATDRTAESVANNFAGNIG
jgi:hypothetical protein